MSTLESGGEASSKRQKSTHYPSVSHVSLPQSCITSDVGHADNILDVITVLKNQHASVRSMTTNGKKLINAMQAKIDFLEKEKTFKGPLDYKTIADEKESIDRSLEALSTFDFSASLDIESHMSHYERHHKSYFNAIKRADARKAKIGELEAELSKANATIQHLTEEKRLAVQDLVGKTNDLEAALERGKKLDEELASLRSKIEEWFNIVVNLQEMMSK